MFIIPVWVSFQRQFLTFSQMSIIMAVRMLLSFFCELPTGAFADLFGRKKSIAIGFLISAFGLIFTGQSRSGIEIAIGLFIMGIGEAFYSGANVAFIYDTLVGLGEENKFQSIKSKSNIIAQAGIVVSSMVAGYLFNINKSLPYYAQAVCCVMTALIYFLMHEEKIKEKFSFVNYWRQTKEGIKEIAKSAYIKQLSWFYILVGGITWSWQQYFNQIFASGIGYSEVGKGWLFAIIRIINSILIFKILGMEKYLSKKKMFLFFPLIMLFSTLPAIWGDKILGTMLLFGMTIASTMRFVVLDNYVNQEFSSRYRATALSTLNMFVRLVYVALVVLSGPVLDKAPTGTVFFLMGILCLFTVLPTGIRLAKREG